MHFGAIFYVNLFFGDQKQVYVKSSLPFKNFPRSFLGERGDRMALFIGSKWGLSTLS